MAWAIRIISGLVVVTAPYIWTVGQAGLENANRNICDLMGTLSPRALPSCHFHLFYLWIWGVGLVAALIFVGFDSTQWVRKTAAPRGGVRVVCGECRTAAAARIKTSWAKVEPTHVIILGLVIAAIGVGWQFVRKPQQTSQNVSSGQKVTVIANKIPAPVPLPLSEFEWGFERHPGYPFIGMMGGAAHNPPVVFQFQAQGRNGTKDPIASARAYVRSDRTGKEYPGFFNIRGQFFGSDQIDPIPVDAIIDIHAHFTPDRKSISIQQFLDEIAPITFFFEYDGKQYRNSFSQKEIETLIRRSEQEMQPKTLPPQMTPKKQTTAVPNNETSANLPFPKTPTTRLAQVGVDQPPTSRPPDYTKQDVERLLEALFQAHEFVNRSKVELEDQLLAVRNDWQAQILKDGPASFIQRLNKVSTAFQGFYTSLLDFTDHQNRYYKDEMRIAVNFDAFPVEIPVSIQKFSDAIYALPDKPEAKTVKLLEDKHSGLDKGFLQWREWIGGANTRIELMRENLRKNGTTGYEKK